MRDCIRKTFVKRTRERDLRSDTMLRLRQERTAWLRLREIGKEERIRLELRGTKSRSIEVSISLQMRLLKTKTTHQVPEIMKPRVLNHQRLKFMSTTVLCKKRSASLVSGAKLWTQLIEILWQRKKSSQSRETKKRDRRLLPITVRLTSFREWERLMPQMANKILLACKLIDAAREFKEEFFKVLNPLQFVAHPIWPDQTSVLIPFSSHQAPTKELVLLQPLPSLLPTIATWVEPQLLLPPLDMPQEQAFHLSLQPLIRSNLWLSQEEKSERAGSKN